MCWRRRSNKFYAQQNRRRKKEYVVGLEAKIEELEKKIVTLSDQIDYYKTKMFSLACGEENAFDDFLKSREYYRNEFIKFTMNQNNKEGFERFQELWQVLGPDGELRRNMIKRLFRSIIDTLIPEGMMFNMKLATEMDEHAHDKYSKLFEVPPATANAMLQKSPFWEGDRIYYELGISTDMRREMLKNKGVFTNLK